MMTDKYSQVHGMAWHGMACRKSCRIAFDWLMWMMCEKLHEALDEIE